MRCDRLSERGENVLDSEKESNISAFPASAAALSTRSEERKGGREEGRSNWTSSSLASA